MGGNGKGASVMTILHQPKSNFARDLFLICSIAIVLTEINLENLVVCINTHNIGLVEYAKQGGYSPVEESGLERSAADRKSQTFSACGEVRNGNGAASKVRSAHRHVEKH